MRSFRRRLHRVLLAVPAVAACSAPPPGPPPVVGAGTTSTTSALTTASRAFGSLSTGGGGASSTTGSGGTTGSGSPGSGSSTSGGSTIAVEGNPYQGKIVCDMVDAGPTCPLCECVDLYSGPDAGLDWAVSSCDCIALCPSPGLTLVDQKLLSCSVTAIDGGGTGLDCYWAVDCGGGRRPEGLVEPKAQPGSAIGAYLAAAAHLEAASVVAFRRMARELAELGAPAQMVARAQVSAREEVAHARVMAAHARRCGARVPRVEVAPWAPRQLEQVAIENAAEGCVGETWGAALTSWQAAHASDPALRADALSISRDEVGHAELAWEVAAWASERLPRSARRRVRAARDRARHELRAGPGPSPELAEAVGLPQGAQRTALLEALDAEFWA